jgi:PAS domain S-box-containing protein
MSAERTQALKAYHIIDTPREAVYDAFVNLAAQMIGVRMAALSFIDEKREWFKAASGFDLDQIESTAGFGFAALQSEFLEVSDAANDARFASSPLVTGHSQVRFYAGVALRTPQGVPIGVFCVMSRVPRSLNTQQRNALRELASTVISALETRRQMLDLFAESRAAKEQIAVLLSAVDVAGDVILVYRVDPKTRELSLTYMNEAYTRQTGYQREGSLGRSLDLFRHDMPDDPGMAELRDAVKRGRPAQLEIVSYRKDGSSFWNQVTIHPVRGESGEITHWISVERDVSEAVEREAKLEDQHARLLLLTSAARRIFGTLEIRTLIARVEDAVRDLVGGTGAVHRIPQPPGAFADPLLARAAQTRGHVTDDSRFRAAASAQSVGTPSYVLEVRARSGGTLRPVDLFMLDLLAEYLGVAVHNAALVEELDERRSAILELNQVKTDLIAMLAHDFKSPLTSIVGFTELSMELGEVNADQREYLESVKKIALRLADLAADTLAFSRLERNEIDLSLQDTDIGAMVREVAESLSDERMINMSISGSGMVRADAHRLRQVLYNLIENAIKYSPGGDPVEVKMRADGERVRIAVSDHGIGIPKKDLPGIFGRFSRASNARKLRIPGTGFGLYLTRQIVELHGGTITVTSIEGKGSTFTVELPIAQSAPREVPMRVLVAEGDRESRSFVAHALREAGYRVHVAHSAPELFDLLAQEPADRVVADLDEIAFSPEQISRLEALQRHGRLQIVTLGSHTNGFGRAASLAKPFLLQDLLGAIRSTAE